MQVKFRFLCECEITKKSADARDSQNRWARAKFSWERVGQHWDHIFQGGSGDIDDVVPVEKEVASLESSKASGRTEL
jgi:hypothetical protein